MRLKFFAFVLAMSSNFADAKLFNSVGGGCPTISQKALSRDAIEKLIGNPKCGIRTVEDVLSHIDKSFFEGYNLVYLSHSLQGPLKKPDFLNPRVIVYGTREVMEDVRHASLMLTFNGKADQPGNNSLEMVEMHPESKDANEMFKFFEVEFPAAGSNAKVRISENNPAKCIRCHSNPAKPIFSSYPLWPGMYGSMRFPSQKISDLETTNYDQFVRYSAQHPRYKYLKPIEGCPGTGCFPSLYEQLEGQTAEADVILARGNVERTAALMMASPEYNKTRFALAAGLLECPDWTRVLPDDVRGALESNMEELFQLKARITEPVMTDFFLKAYESDDTRELPWKQGGPATFEGAIASLKEIFGSDSAYWRLQVDTLMKQGSYQDALMPASLRLLMEGRGIRVSDWFLGFDQDTYRIHDGGIVESEGWLYALMRRDSVLAPLKTRVDAEVENRRNEKTIDPALCNELGGIL